MLLKKMRHRGVHSDKFRTERRKRRQAFFFLVILCLLTIGAASILLMKAPFFQIKTVIVEGDTISPHEAISSVALSSLGGSYFHVIPRSNIFFFSKGAIEDALAHNFKELKKFSIHRSGLSSITLSLVERTPSAVICAGFRDETSKNDCYWGDEHGYIFGSIATSSLDSAVDTLSHYYVSSADTTVAPGTNFIPEKRFTDLQNFLSGAAKGGLLPLGVLVGDNGEYEMYIKNKNSNSEVTVYFDDRSPFEKTLENLLTFWNNADTKKATTTPSFDYINLRFGNTVYYSTQ
jgi:hypothetical protein